MWRGLEAECVAVRRRGSVEREFSRRSAQKRWKQLTSTDWWDVVVEVGIVSLGPERVESLRALFEAARDDGSGS